MTSCSWLAVSSVPPCDTLPRIPLCLSQPQMMIQFTFTTAFNNQFNSLIFNFSHTLCWYYYLEWTVTSSTDQSVKQSAWNHIRGSGSVLTCPICCSVAVAGCWSSSSLYAERTEHLHICSTPSTHHLTENTPHTLHDNQQTLQVTQMEKGCDWLTAKDSEPSAGEILMSSQHQVAQVSQVLILSVKDSTEMFRVYSIIILIEWCEYLFVNLMQHVSNM